MMDDSVMGGSMVMGSSAAGGRMLDVEGSLHHHQHHQSMAMAMGMGGVGVSFPGTCTGSLENDQGLIEYKGTCTPKNSMICKGKPTTSEEDEPSFTEDGTDSHLSGGGKNKKNSPWQRMKWSDGMVRLLITAVLYVGEDGGPDCTDGNKRKSGVLQKKGKWKSVSKVMMERGCSVSPQQCEDKFNDLNKRYKRLNDILGRGTTCRVVENLSLLDTMPHLSAKTKEDVRKLLNSKHLFYKEMCAYHNSSQMHTPHELDSQACTQYSILGKNKEGHEFCELVKEENAIGEEDDNENDDGIDDDDDDDGDDGDENGVDAEVEETGDFGKRRRMNKSFEEAHYWARPMSAEFVRPSTSDNPSAEMLGVLDTMKTPWEQREWMKNRNLQLQEQKVSLQAEAFELEKRLFKWQKLCSKKDRELERLKLENERMKLENERMILQLKQKELEIEFKRSEASMPLVSLPVERFQGREQDELGRGHCLP